MAECAFWKLSRTLRSWATAIGVAVKLAATALVLMPVSAASQESGSMQNHVLAIGTCPPWHVPSVEVCMNSLKKVLSALSPRLDAGPEHQHLLVNEGASASALKLKATELSNQLNENDRLIIYANVPLGLAETANPDDAKGYVLELWAAEEPEGTLKAVSDGTWMSASAFAALLHTIPAGEVILILDTNNPHAVDIGLLATHNVDHKDRPEALVISSGPGQAANYSADRTISLFAKHLSHALEETDGSLLDVMTVAAGGTRQSAIPICADLMGTLAQEESQAPDCAQVPEIHDPDALMSRTMLLPLSESDLQN